MRARVPIGQAIGCRLVALRVVERVQPIVGHAAFFDRLDQGQVSLAATLRAAKGLGAVVDFLKAPDAQRDIAPAYIAAHPHGAECLAQSAEGEGLMGASVTTDNNADAD